MSVAVRGTGVRERLAGNRDELPVVAAGPQGQLEDAVRPRVADLAVGADRREGPRWAAGGPDHELPDPVRAGLAARGLGCEPFVVVVVPVEDQLRAGRLERIPQRPDRGIVAVVAGREEGLVPHGRDTGARVGREVCTQPGHLFGAGATAHLGAVGVEVVHAPGSQVLRVPALARRAGPRAEVGEVGGRAGTVVVVVAGDGRGPQTPPAPRRSVAVAELGRRPVRVGDVARRKHPARDAVEQVRRAVVTGAAAGGDVARAHQHGVCGWRVDHHEAVDDDPRMAGRPHHLDRDRVRTALRPAGRVQHAAMGGRGAVRAHGPHPGPVEVHVGAPVAPPGGADPGHLASREGEAEGGAGSHGSQGTAAEVVRRGGRGPGARSGDARVGLRRTDDAERIAVRPGAPVARLVLGAHAEAGLVGRPQADDRGPGRGIRQGDARVGAPIHAQREAIPGDPGAGVRPGPGHAERIGRGDPATCLGGCGQGDHGGRRAVCGEDRRGAGRPGEADHRGDKGQPWPEEVRRPGRSLRDDQRMHGRMVRPRALRVIRRSARHNDGPCTEPGTVDADARSPPPSRHSRPRRRRARSPMTSVPPRNSGTPRSSARPSSPGVPRHLAGPSRSRDDIARRPPCTVRRVGCPTRARTRWPWWTRLARRRRAA